MLILKMKTIPYIFGKDQAGISGFASFFLGRSYWGKTRTNFVHHNCRTQKITPLLSYNKERQELGYETRLMMMADILGKCNNLHIKHDKMICMVLDIFWKALEGSLIIVFQKQHIWRKVSMATHESDFFFSPFQEHKSSYGLRLQ